MTRRLGDEGTWGRGDLGTRRRGDLGTRGLGVGDLGLGTRRLGVGDEETWRCGKGSSDGVLNSVRVLELFFCVEVLYTYYGGGIPFFVEGFGFSAFFVGETYE